MAAKPKENLSKLIAGLFEISPGNFVHRWLRMTDSGDASVVDGSLEAGPIYDDTNYQYFGEAAPSLPAPALTNAVWRVSRIDKSTGRQEYLDAGNFSQVYTDLPTVQALFVAERGA